MLRARQKNVIIRHNKFAIKALHCYKHNAQKHYTCMYLSRCIRKK